MGPPNLTVRVAYFDCVYTYLGILPHKLYNYKYDVVFNPYS